VDRSTNSSNNPQRLRRPKGAHRPKRNPSVDTSKNIQNASGPLGFISIGSCPNVLIVAARWFDITTLKSCKA
jgi:hypothetical protein